MKNIDYDDYDDDDPALREGLWMAECLDNEERANRGSSWDHEAWDSRESDNSWDAPACHFDTIGFRVLHRKKP